MIVRAKYKLTEALEPSLFCCTTAKLSIRDVQGNIFLLDASTKERRKVRCMWCGFVYEHTAMLVVEGQYKGFKLSVDVVDIDEGSAV